MPLHLRGGTANYYYMTWSGIRMGENRKREKGKRRKVDKGGRGDRNKGNPYLKRAYKYSKIYEKIFCRNL